MVLWFCADYICFILSQRLAGIGCVNNHMEEEDVHE